MDEALYSEYETKILELNATSWEGRGINRNKILNWLENFENDNEKLYAIHLLSHFMYFGSNAIRELLRTLYRDLYKYPIIESIRRANSDTLNLSLLNSSFETALDTTRFLGIGNPSESGPHLLYYFRQENNLPKNLFINAHEIFKKLGSSLEVNDPAIKYYVCIDDFCGSGQQGIDFGEEIVMPLKSKVKDVKVDYFVLFATDSGKKAIRKSGYFNNVKSVFTLDDSFKCFHSTSRYFDSSGSIDKALVHKMCEKYGSLLFESILRRSGFSPTEAAARSKDHACGFEDGQLLIGFHHNTPDNTLPIIWYDEEFVKWIPIFKRYNKKYE